MQHAPFRHVRVAYPRIISAPVSARAKCTNFSGNNQTVSRSEKELSDGVAGAQVAAGIHRERTLQRALPAIHAPRRGDPLDRPSVEAVLRPYTFATVPAKAGAPSSAQSGGSPSLAPVGTIGRSPPTHLHQCLLLSFADESRRSQSVSSTITTIAHS